MELIVKLDRRPIGSQGKKKTFGLFRCPSCGVNVEKTLSHGLEQQSCGCASGEKHGMKKTPLYRVWVEMRRRCVDPSRKFFHRYGGRGITVCTEWQKFSTFHDWALANGYREDLLIDRRDNDGNYCPDNCRFVTDIESSRNRSSTKLTHEKAITIRKLRRDANLTQEQVGKMFGVSCSTVRRIERNEIWN